MANGSFSHSPSADAGPGEFGVNLIQLPAPLGRDYVEFRLVARLGAVGRGGGRLNESLDGLPGCITDRGNSDLATQVTPS